MKRRGRREKRGRGAALRGAPARFYPDGRQGALGPAVPALTRASGIVLTLEGGPVRLALEFPWARSPGTRAGGRGADAGRAGRGRLVRLGTPRHDRTLGPHPGDRIIGIQTYLWERSTGATVGGRREERAQVPLNKISSCFKHVCHKFSKTILSESELGGPTCFLPASMRPRASRTRAGAEPPPPPPLDAAQGTLDCLCPDCVWSKGWSVSPAHQGRRRSDDGRGPTGPQVVPAEGIPRQALSTSRPFGPAVLQAGPAFSTPKHLVRGRDLFLAFLQPAKPSPL